METIGNEWVPPCTSLYKTCHLKDFAYKSPCDHGVKINRLNIHINYSHIGRDN